jgi:ribosomal protein S8E
LSQKKIRKKGKNTKNIKKRKKMELAHDPEVVIDVLIVIETEKII